MTKDRAMPFGKKCSTFTRFKQSYGIACCRFNLKTEKPEVLLIKKKYTYAFFEFVFAKYKKRDNTRLRKLFNQMSHQEKLDILELNFDKLWCKIRVHIPLEKNKVDRVSTNNYHMGAYETYTNKKDRFYNNFIKDDKGDRLIKLIRDTTSIDSIWELPKGRPNNGEKPINTAIREFKEETDIDYDKYKFLLHIPPIVESYTVNKCRYKHTYFIAAANEYNWDPVLNFSSYEQLAEVENIRWICLDEAKYLNLKQIEPQLKIMHILEKIIAIFKNNYKFSDIVKK